MLSAALCIKLNTHTDTCRCMPSCRQDHVCGGGELVHELKAVKTTMVRLDAMRHAVLCMQGGAVSGCNWGQLQSFHGRQPGVLPRYTGHANAASNVCVL